MILLIKKMSSKFYHLNLGTSNRINQITIFYNMKIKKNGEKYQQIIFKIFIYFILTKLLF